jgi:hypothetical protein
VELVEILVLKAVYSRQEKSLAIECPKSAAWRCACAAETSIRAHDAWLTFSSDRTSKHSAAWHGSHAKTRDPLKGVNEKTARTSKLIECSQGTLKVSHSED